MAENIYQEPAGSLIKTTLVDFPHRVASTIFLEGCNLRCPYCYNTELVLCPSLNLKKAERAYPCSTLEEIITHLSRRQGLITGLVISGGEPLLNKRTEILIREAKKLGYKIKLDTNGTLPDILQEFISDEELHPDYIAMDIKTNPAHYSLLTKNSMSKNYSDEELYKSLSRSAKIISSSYRPEDREWRTVLVPPLVKEADIEAIAAILPKDALWYFSQFRNENCLDPSYNEISPYLDKDITALVEKAKQLIQGAQLR